MRRLLLGAVLVVLLAGCGGSTISRPSGVAERWLQAVSDMGRPSVREDAADKAERHGSLDAAEPLLDGVRFEEDESRFTDLEVGAATDDGRVPLRVTRRLADDERDELFLTAVLERDDGGEWRVVELDEPRDGELVPSEGGDRPASATFRHWLAAVAVGLLLAVASALVIEAQPAVRQQARPGYVPAAPQRP